MIKCSPKAFAQCQIKCHHCKTMDEACFLEGSDCDKFNQMVLAAPKTNGDRLRQMSDEELADWLARTQIANTAEALAIAKIPFEQSTEQKEYVTKECLEWLKQPAEDANPFHYEKGCQPHGAEQFAKACAVCVNRGSDLCRDCKAEKKSGFEPPF